VISKYLPSFPSIERRTRLHLPYSGSLGHHFPTFPVPFMEPSVLCSAKTAKSPSQVRSLFAILTCYLACFLYLCLLLNPRTRSRTKAGSQTPGLLISRYPSSSGCFHKEAFGSPKFPSYPFEHMPWSETPVVPLILAISHAGLLPSEQYRASAFS
jgi:hypothetical protein